MVLSERARAGAKKSESQDSSVVTLSARYVRYMHAMSEKGGMAGARVGTKDGDTDEGALQISAKQRNIEQGTGGQDRAE
jgi:hypothetical protein